MALSDPLSEQVIGGAIEVHRSLGPGLLESAYEECLCFEFKERGLPFRRQIALPIEYKGVRLDCGYRIDPTVKDELIVEAKAVERLMPIHEAQLLTYLRLSQIQKGLLLNFHSPVLREGIRRMSLTSREAQP